MLFRLVDCGGRATRISIWGLPKLRALSTRVSYDNGMYVAAAILLGSAVLMSFMPKYRHGAGHVAEPAAGTPLAQQV